MTALYLPHLYAPDEPELAPVEYADLLPFDVGVGADLAGEAIFTDAFGTVAHEETNVWLVVVRSRSHTQVGASFGETSTEALDEALYRTTRPVAGLTPDPMATADLIRPLGKLGAIDDLIAAALCGTLAAHVSNAAA